MKETVKFLRFRLYIVTDAVKFNDTGKLQKRTIFQYFEVSYLKKMTFINSSLFFEMH